MKTDLSNTRNANIIKNSLNSLPSYVLQYLLSTNVNQWTSHILENLVGQKCLIGHIKYILDIKEYHPWYDCNSVLPFMFDILVDNTGIDIALKEVKGHCEKILKIRGEGTVCTKKY